MKRRFTILTAALALLTFLAVPMGMRGQTRTNQTAFYGFETGDAGWTATSFVTNNTAITAHGGSKYGATNGSSTAYVKYDALVANPQSLTCYYSKTSTNTNAGSHFEIQVSSDNSTWTTVESGLGMNQVEKGTWYELTADLSSYSDVYVRVYYIGTSAVRALDDITLIYDDGTAPSTDPEITFTPTSITLDEVLVGNEVSATITVAQANLTSDITLSVDNGSLSTSSIAQGADATNVTWTYTPTTAGAINATVTATSGTTTETLAISGTAIAPVDSYDVNFEYATDMYPNWTFDNMTTYQTGSITAHGGTYYGTTGGKATASITTTSTVANPGTLTCYVSKQSGNTTSSTWYIQVSENGSTWINVESHSATSMSQGSWVEFTADLTDYTDVYVRVYYSGSTAIRNIDDLTLTTVEPSSDPSITAADVNIAYDAEEGIINYTINNPVEGGSIVASCDAEWIEVDDTPQTDAEGSIDFICAPNSNFYAHSATVTLTYTYDDSKATVTKIVTVTQALNPDANGSTIDYPIMVSEAIDAIDEVGTVSNIYVGGIVSNIVTEYSSQYHNITFDMIDEEGNEYFLRAYRCGGNEAADVKVGDEVIVYGNLTKYGSIYEFGQGCELVSLIHPAVPSITVNPDVVNVDATPAAGEDFIEGTLDLTWENLEITDFFEDFAIQYYDAEGEELADDPNWIMVDLATQDPNIGEGYLVSYMIEENEGTEARTAYFKVFALGDEDYVYSNLVTISQAAPVAPVTGDKYVKVTSTADLTSGQYLIVYEEGSVAFDGSLETLDAESNTIEVTINDSEIGIDNITIAAEFTIDVTTGTIMSASGYYIGQTSNANGMQTSLETAYTNTISIDESGNANIISSGGAYLRYNNASNQNRFRYYKSSTYTGQKAIQLYKKVGEPATETYTLEIAGYGDSDGGYYLIASPAAIKPATVEDPESHENMILTGDDAVNYDLYAFDESEDDEWRNYKTQAFNLQPGKGYLYAHKRGGNFAIVGVPYSGDGKVTLQKTEGNYWEGWNLIGNPWGTAATIETEEGEEVSFYVMGEDGKSFIAGDNSVDPMQGIFVIAASDGQEVTFEPAETPAPGEGKLIVNLTASRSSVIDRAIVRFGQGTELPKFMFNPNSTKIYIPQSGEDYAVVRSAGEAEMPVNFKAAQNGTYTLSINPANVEMEYLHLVDNMTGTDIDLLATPSYTFEASTTDAANRFSLMYGVETGVNEDKAANFAYFNGSQWVVNNSGDATLQVVDALGRVVSTKTINGNAEVSIDQTTGVYMIRLINGNNVKTQKVVVK